jgi:hypothetical protein
MLTNIYFIKNRSAQNLVRCHFQTELNQCLLSRDWTGLIEAWLRTQAPELLESEEVSIRLWKDWRSKVEVMAKLGNTIYDAGFKKISSILNKKRLFSLHL